MQQHLLGDTRAQAGAVRNTDDSFKPSHCVLLSINDSTDVSKHAQS